MQNCDNRDERRTGLLRAAFALAVVFAVFCLLQAPTEATASDRVSGTWRGNGVAVEKKNGKRRKVRCRLTVSNAGGRSYTVSGRCADTDGVVSARGTVKQVGNGRYTGTLNTASQQGTGRITISSTGSSLSLSLSGNKGWLHATFLRN